MVTLGNLETSSLLSSCTSSINIFLLYLVTYCLDQSNSHLIMCHLELLCNYFMGINQTVNSKITNLLHSKFTLSTNPVGLHPSSSISRIWSLLPTPTDHCHPNHHGLLVNQCTCLLTGLLLLLLPSHLPLPLSSLLPALQLERSFKMVSSLSCSNPLVACLPFYSK